jgi:hypothetical protein
MFIYAYTCQKGKAYSVCLAVWSSLRSTANELRRDRSEQTHRLLLGKYAPGESQAILSLEAYFPSNRYTVVYQ